MKIVVKGLTDAQQRLSRIIGVAGSQKEIAAAIGPATRVVADAWRDVAPVSPRGVRSGDNVHAPGGIKRAVVAEKVGRGAKTGRVSVYAMIDRKKAKQAGFIQGGTKRQKPQPIFTRAARAVREKARQVAMQGLQRMAARFPRL